MDDAVGPDRQLLSLRAVATLLMDASDAEPIGADRVDSTGTVRVLVGPDGAVERIVLGDGWRRAVGAEKLAAAIEEAATARDVGDNVVPAGFEEKLARIKAWARGEADERPPEVPPDGPAPALTTPEERDSLARDARMLLALEPGDAVGFAAFGKVAVTFGLGGSFSCIVDPDWVARRADADVAEAVDAALSAARIELAALVRRYPS